MSLKAYNDCAERGKRAGKAGSTSQQREYREDERTMMVTMTGPCVWERVIRVIPASSPAVCRSLCWPVSLSGARMSDLAGTCTQRKYAALGVASEVKIRTG